MGMLTSEQTVEIIEAVKTPTNYWWLLLIAIIPVVLGYIINKKRGN